MSEKCLTPLFDVKKVGRVTVVTFTVAILDQKLIEELRVPMNGLASEMGLQLLLNFENVESFESPMLGRLNVLTKLVRAVEGRMALCGMHPLLQQVFHITGLVPVYTFYDDEAAALEKFH